MDILYKEESYLIIGAAIAVHTELGSGFLEAVYQEALEREFIINNILYKREVPLIIYQTCSVTAPTSWRANFVSDKSALF